MALLTLASLTPKEHRVYIEDENVKDIYFNDKPDLVGITINVDTSARAYKIAACYREKGIPVIAGGIHASANPDESLNFVDAVCIGDAEELWEQIILDASKGELKKKYCNNGRFNPSAVPVPSWKHIDTSKYLYTNIISTSRGCPYKCEFCYNSCNYAKDRYGNRPIDHVVEEIKRLKTKHIMFIDDNLIGNTGWAGEFFKAIRPLGLKWNGAVSANLLYHLDLLDEMKKSGCQSLFIGFESINSDSLKSVSKYQNNINMYEKLIDEIHSRGIMINASLVFGLDGDKPDVFKNTLDWLVKNKVETMTAHILTPYPGTVIFEKYKSDGRIINFNWENYNTSHIVFKPKNMSCKELYDGYIWIYKEFYSFKNILKRMPKARTQWIPYLLFGLGYRKFGRITSKIAKLGFMNILGRVARRLSYGVG
jgi:radical SAM superfamily enzyme YgiQ (UPF0313 family)